MSVGWVAAGATLASGALGASASRSASKAQANAANQANATSTAQYYQTRKDNAPWQQAGTGSINQLQYLLGTVDPSNGLNGIQRGPLSGADLVDLSTGVPTVNQDLYATNADYRQAWDRLFGEHVQRFGRGYDEQSNVAAVQQGLSNALAPMLQREAEQEAAQREANRQQFGANGDPLYGSLNRQFTQEDFWADPVTKLGFQFGLDEGTKGVNRLAAAGGSLNSGKTLKALTRFGNDYASTKGNESFNRFEANKTNTFNRLAGIAGVGQTANSANQQAGQVMANNVSQNQIGVGNARAASAIGQANALTGVLGQGFNLWQQNRLAGQQQYGVPQQPGVTGWVSQG